MANNKTRQGVGKPSRDTLSAIDRVLAEMDARPIQPDEFTVGQILERDPCASYTTINRMLRMKLGRGELAKRVISINGKASNVYRYV